MNRHKSRSAFTLIELIATVAIVLILAILTFGAGDRVIGASKATKCAANLRTIYAASSSWTVDNNGRIVPVFFPGDPNKAGSLRNWTGLLAPYLGRTSTEPFVRADEMPAFVCPTAPHQFGYGYNHRFLSYIQDSLGIERWATLGSVQKPSQTVMFACSENLKAPRDVFGSWKAYMRSPLEMGWTGDCPPAFVHPGKTANVLWLDGHISAEKADSDFWKDDTLWDRQ